MLKDLSNLTIPEVFLDKIIEHARREYPLECCGILAGKKGKIIRVYSLENIEKSPFSYRVEPEKQFRVFRAIEEDGLELSAIYHSHPYSPPYPSQRDIDLAFYPDSLILIISLMNQQVPEVCAFQIEEGKNEKRAIKISAKEQTKFKKDLSRQSPKENFE